jgi:hypothetical protein
MLMCLSRTIGCIDEIGYIQYFGGTLGMKKDSTTGALSIEKHHLAAQLMKYPEFQDPEMPHFKVLEHYTTALLKL